MKQKAWVFFIGLTLLFLGTLTAVVLTAKHNAQYTVVEATVVELFYRDGKSGCHPSSGGRGSRAVKCYYKLRFIGAGGSEQTVTTNKMYSITTFVGYTVKAGYKAQDYQNVVLLQDGIDVLVILLLLFGPVWLFILKKYILH